MSLARGAIAVAVVGLGFAALAQQFGDGDRKTPPGPASAGSTAAPPFSPQPQGSQAPRSQVDESALRYFASQGDTRRIDAEIARLRALYPDWTPPGDLSQPAAGAVVKDPEVDRLWTLYSEGRMAEVRAAITERQASDPQWKPPPELLTALDGAEARRRLINASDNGQWRTVLSIATESPNFLTCANVDVLWRVAEAFAKTDEPNRTRDVYAYVLTNCPNPAERLGTLQKALGLLPEQQVTEFLRLERRSGENPDDFGAIRDELARRRVERASTDDKAIAAAADLATVERLVESKSEPDNALLLGWYNHHRKNPQKALGWFKTALDRNGGPKAAEGYALTLWDLDRIGEAEAFAYEWRDKAPENLQAYLDIATALLSQDPPPRLDPPVVARVVPAITRKRFSNGAQALGWYSYNTGQVPTARQWFRTALSWKADDESSAYGAALASQRLNDRPGFNALVAQWRDRSPRIADLASGVAPGRAVPQPPVAAQTIVTQTVESAPATRAEPRIIHVERLSQAEGRRPQTRQAAVRPGSGVRRNCTMTRNPGGLSADAALTLGWCLMELNRPLEAVAAFDRAVNNGSGRTREEAAYGKTLAYLRKDLTAQAALAASEAPQSIERRTELNATILAQRAIAAYRDGRFAETLLALGERGRIVPEQNDLMLIKGWSYFKLGHYNDAEKVFRAVQRTGNSE